LFSWCYTLDPAAGIWQRALQFSTWYRFVERIPKINVFVLLWMIVCCLDWFVFEPCTTYFRLWRSRFFIILERAEEESSRFSTRLARRFCPHVRPQQNRHRNCMPIANICARFICVGIYSNAYARTFIRGSVENDVTYF